MAAVFGWRVGWEQGRTVRVLASLIEVVLGRSERVGGGSSGGGVCGR